MTQAMKALVPHRRQFENVVVATDFSVGAAQAVSRARLLPLAEGGRLSIVHVLPNGLPEKRLAAIEGAARRQLGRAVAALSRPELAGGRADIEVTSELRRGQAYVEIIRYARAVGADLVVLGRHGRRPVKDMFIGSTAERVIRMGGIPVLVVSRKAARGYRRLLLAVDLEDTARPIAEVALRIVGTDVKAATMLHAYHVPFEGFITPAASPDDVTGLRKEYRETAASGLARLQASLADLGLRWQTAISRGDPRTVIPLAALRRRADVLAVGTHGRSGLSHALIGSVAEWVIQVAPCDVLVARPARVSFDLP